MLNKKWKKKEERINRETLCPSKSQTYLPYQDLPHPDTFSQTCGTDIPKCCMKGSNQAVPAPDSYGRSNISRSKSLTDQPLKHSYACIKVRKIFVLPVLSDRPPPPLLHILSVCCHPIEEAEDKDRTNYCESKIVADLKKEDGHLCDLLLSVLFRYVLLLSFSTIFNLLPVLFSVLSDQFEPGERTKMVLHDVMVYIV